MRGLTRCEMGGESRVSDNDEELTGWNRSEGKLELLYGMTYGDVGTCWDAFVK